MRTKTEFQIFCEKFHGPQVRYCTDGSYMMGYHEPGEPGEFFSGNIESHRFLENPGVRYGRVAYDLYGHPVPGMKPVFTRDRNMIPKLKPERLDRIIYDSKTSIFIPG